MYTVGREYGTASIKIHIPQCQQLWLERESQKPKHERRPLPKEPVLNDININSNSNNSNSLEAYNDAAYKQYQTQSMIQCEYCGRRFADDRIAIHHKSCTADKPAKRVEEVAIRTTTGNAVPHRLDALAHKALQQQNDNVRPRTQSSLTHKSVSNKDTTLNKSMDYVYNNNNNLSSPTNKQHSRPKTQSSLTPQPPKTPNQSNSNSKTTKQTNYDRLDLSSNNDIDNESKLQSPTNNSSSKIPRRSFNNVNNNNTVNIDQEVLNNILNDSADLKARVTALEHQLDMLLCTLNNNNHNNNNDDSNVSTTATTDCHSCAASTGVAVFCSQCGSKQ